MSRMLKRYGATGQLEQALAEFEKAYGLDPASEIAVQEIRRTKEMIERY